MAATPIPDNRAAFSLAEIVQATGATLVAGTHRSVVGVGIDSRRITTGNLFVALRGEIHDGHRYVGSAIASGASAVLVQDEVDVPAGATVLRVDDTLGALGALAAFHRRRFDVPVVAITGSVGKTTTKELIAAALEGVGRRTMRTRGNLNNRVGVPMTLLTLDADHDAAVVELGMNVPGEIRELAERVHPTIGVVTSVAEVHTEGVGGLDGVAQEKGALLEALDPHATAVWCSDYELLAPYADRSAAGRKIGYGERQHSDVALTHWTLEGGALEERIATRATYRLANRSVDIRLKLLGRAAASNAAAALAVIEVIEPARLDDAASALGRVLPSLHRMVPAELSSGILLLDDCYNASPTSTVAALETAAALASSRGGEVVAVLADMLELGHEEQRLHAEVGREAARVGVRALVAVGERMSHAGGAALNAGAKGGRRPRVVLLRSADAAAACVRELAQPRDVVLVKGSRGMRMERVVEALRAPEDRGGQ